MSDDIRVTWDDNSGSEDGYRVYRSTDGGSTWTQASDDLPADTTSWDDIGLLDGEEYIHKVEAFNDGGASESGNSNTVVTDLPDATPPTLDVSTENELYIDWDSTTDNGGVRVEYRRTSSSSWQHDATYSPNLTSSTIYGVDDGEEYEVRLRNETDHATGSWTTPVSAITTLPGPTDLSVTGSDSQSVDLLWSGNADNGDGFDIIRQTEYNDGWGASQTIATVGTGTVSYTDGTVQPGSTYRYRVRAFTEHTDAVSDFTDPVSIEIAGLEAGADRGSGWHAKIEHESGTVHTPTVLEDGTKWIPKLKDQPRIQVAVPKADKWESGGFEECPMTVWKDGHELPIDEVVSVTRESGNDVIEGIGGTELEQDIDPIQYPESDSHAAAGDVVSTFTSYATDIDNPSTQPRTDVPMKSISSTTSFRDNIEDDPFRDDYPIRAFNGEVLCDPTAQFIEAEDGSGGSQYIANQEGNAGAWSGDRVIELSPGDTLEIGWDDLNHGIPEGDAIMEMVYSVPDEPTPGLEIEVDVADDGVYQAEDIANDALISTSDWFDLVSWETTLNGGGGSDYNGTLPGTLTNSVLINNKSGSSTSIFIDFVHLRDDRFSYNTNDTTPVDEVVQGWEPYPASVDLVFTPSQAIERVVGASVDVGVTNTLNNQSIALRNDANANWDVANNSAEHSTDFAEASQMAQARVTLSRYDSSGGSSGDFGGEFQTLSYLNLQADLVNTPVLLDFVAEGRLLDVLNRIAESGDFIWEVRRIDGQDTIVWTQPGLRTTDTEPDLISYTGKRTTERSYQRVIVHGKSRSVEGETWQMSSGSSFRGFSEGPPLVPGKETVYDTGEDPTVYERNVDYEIDYDLGGIRLVDDGSLEHDTEYLVDYQWRYSGEYVDPSATDPRTKRVSFPDASSNRECDRLASSIVRRVSEPLEEAKATVKSVAPDQPLTESISPDRIPFDGPYRVRKMESTPMSFVQTLGNRRSANEVVEDIKQKLDALSRNF